MVTFLDSSRVGSQIKTYFIKGGVSLYHENFPNIYQKPSFVKYYWILVSSRGVCHGLNVSLMFASVGSLTNKSPLCQVVIVSSEKKMVVFDKTKIKG